MRTVNRREFNHQMARILDHVLETGEEVRISGRDGRALIVSVDHEITRSAVRDRWERLGLIQHSQLSSEDVLAFEPMHLPQGLVEEALAAMDEDY